MRIAAVRKEREIDPAVDALKTCVAGADHDAKLHPVAAKRLRDLGRIGRWLQVAAGVVMITMGIAMITGQLSAFAVWLLNTFPIFSTIG